MKLIGNSSYGYQLMDLSKHSKTQYVVGAEVHKLVNERNFNNLNVLPSSIYEVEMVKSEVNHKEPIIVESSFCNTPNSQRYNSFTIFLTGLCFSKLRANRNVYRESLYGSNRR